MTSLASLLLKATLVAVLVLLATRLGRRYAASVRHLMLAAGFFVVLALPGAMVLAQAAGLEMPLVVAMTQPVMADAVPAPDIDMAVTARPMAADPSTTASGSAAWWESLSLREVLLAVWTLGALISMAPIAIGLLQMRRYRRFGMPARRDQATLLRRLAADARMSRPIRLLAHESIAGPLTYGIVRPVVFLPRDSNAWTPDALRRALVHELEHIRRGDWLIHCASRLVCALYWFHPLIWVMWRQLALEAERACDDAVLREAEATQYADQLVDLAERLSLEERRPLLAMAGRDELMTRISAVLDPTLPRARAGLASVGIGLAALLVICAVAPLRAVSLSLPQVAAAVFTSEVAPPLVAPVEVPGVPAPAPRVLATPAQVTPAAPPPAERPTFTVASVKINRSGGRTGGPRPVVGGRYVATNTPIELVIASAYAPLQRFEIEGMPDWAATTRVDIEAVAEGAVAGEVTPAGARPPQINLMLQSLLADRFQLVVHREVRQQPVYALVQTRAGELGPQLKPHTDDTGCADPVAAAPAGRPDPTKPLPPPPCGAWSGAPALGRLAGQKVLLDTFGRAISGQLGRMVLDRTGLAGLFDLTLEWTPIQQLPGLDPSQGAGLAGTPDRPSIFTAVQEQLGLKLDSQTGPVSVLVIDRLELPTGN
jgi:uncharacterized protein (TIGR03435 family)